MKRVFLSLGIVLFAAVASAQALRPRVQLTVKENVNGVPVVAIRGENLQDSDVFSIRVTDRLEGETGWYQSKSGKTEWEVNSKTGKFYMQISDDLLEPGYVFEVRTYVQYYNGDTEETHRFRFGLPCERNSYYDAFSDSIWIYENHLSVSPSACGYVPPLLPPPPPPISQACYYDAIKVANGARLSINVSCKKHTGVDVRVYDKATGTILCNENRYATDFSKSACEISRNPKVKGVYLVEIRTAEGELFSGTKTVVKDPTYNYQPAGSYRHGLSLYPEKQNKALGRGYFWESTVSAKVMDQDVDASEGQLRIKAELILMKNNGERVLATKYANSGDHVSFTVEHQYIEPLMFGDPKHEGDIDFGRNTLRIRVWDAYNGTTFVDLDPVQVEIRF